jgi:hypothetical protein
MKISDQHEEENSIPQNREALLPVILSAYVYLPAVFPTTASSFTFHVKFYLFREEGTDHLMKGGSVAFSLPAFLFIFFIAMFPF